MTKNIGNLVNQLAPEDNGGGNWRQAKVVSLVNSGSPQSTNPPKVNIQIGGSTTIIPGVPCSTWYTPRVNDIVWVVSDGPSKWVIGQVGWAIDPLAPRMVAYNADNLTSTGNVWIIDQQLGFSFPFKTRMLVEVAGRAGFSGALNLLTIQVAKINGASILSDSGGGYQITQHGGHWAAVSVMGWTDIPAGELIGYKVGYNVNTSNTYLRLTAKVSWMRLD